MSHQVNAPAIPDPKLNTKLIRRIPKCLLCFRMTIPLRQMSCGHSLCQLCMTSHISHTLCCWSNDMPVCCGCPIEEVDVAWANPVMVEAFRAFKPTEGEKAEEKANHKNVEPFPTLETEPFPTLETEPFPTLEIEPFPALEVEPRPSLETKSDRPTKKKFYCSNPRCAAELYPYPQRYRWTHLLVRTCKQCG
ncbi:hypothetical protein F4821DRAFT_280622 [Hypoxylon rubiginosum]|uniref:Uncharacterized protein n=1 Tax=Hypoxylon rubiginosum TaxID=110542 RepID=A0ACC0CUH8_9PEZI|nr:hypothetical protein F4821DRAFT_280622 [Hypoxylon rubiginosum]